MSENKKTRVLQTTFLGIGGITSMVLNIQEHMDREQVFFDYLVFRDQKEPAEERALKFGSKKIIANTTDGKTGFMKLWLKLYRTYKALKKSEFDVLHINVSSPHAAFIGIPAKLAKVPKVVVHSHNANSSANIGAKKIANAISKSFMALYVDEFLACSTEAAEFMFPKSVIKKKNYTIVKNGIDVSKYGFSQSVREEYRAKLNVTDELLFGHIGRFEKQKNHRFLLDIFAEIHKKNEKTKLLLIGIGDLMEEIKAYAEEKGLMDCVNFYGSTQEVPQLLQAMDCFLFPSLYEGLPVVGVEVQASGLPIFMADTITTEVGITELAHYLPLNMSAKEWADKVLCELSDMPERRAYHEEVKEAGFDICDVAKKMTELYKN